MLFKHLGVGRVDERVILQSRIGDACTEQGPQEMQMTRKASKYSQGYSGWSKVFSCDQCQFKTTYQHVLKRHKRVHTGDFFRCHLCKCHFSDKLQLSHHLRGHAGNLRCKFCNRNFTYMSALKRHEKIHIKKDGVF